MADKLENLLVRREFDENELISLKEQYFTKSSNLDDLSEEFKALEKEFKEKIKRAKIDLKYLQTEIRRGGEEIYRDVVGVPDYEKSVMEYFDVETSEKYHSLTRRLKPKEKEESNNNNIQKMRKVSNG